MSTAKRRKLDQETASNGSNPRGTTSRQRAAAAASKAATAAQQAAAAAVSKNGSMHGDTGPYVPVLSLSTLPVAALSRYALHYGLIPPEPLTPAQATYPTPALPVHLTLASSTLVPTRRRASLVPERHHRHSPSYARQQLQHQHPTSSLRAPAAAADGDTAPSSVPTTKGTTSTGDAVSASDKGATQGPDNRGVPHTADEDGHTANTSARQTPLDPSKPSDDTNADASTGDHLAAGSAHGPPTPHQISAGSVSQSNGADASASGSRINGSGKLKAGAALAEQGREWIEPGEPDAVELRGMTAYYGGVDQVKERLGKLATSHWEKITSVKEGETIINFAYAVRMRSKILKSVPAS